MGNNSVLNEVILQAAKGLILKAAIKTTSIPELSLIDINDQNTMTSIVDMTEKALIKKLGAKL